jgi:mannose-6-phosphate isomerase-like protein (cupin superfamily)
MTQAGMSAIDLFTVAPGEGDWLDFGDVRVALKIEAEDSGGRFAVVEHRISPSALASPLHMHRNEDEFTYVLDGTLGAIVGDQTVVATTGSWLLKPRGVWHASWNAGVSACRMLEVIAPTGFERYFTDLAEIFDSEDGGTPDVEHVATLNERYDVEMDFDSILELCVRFGLTHRWR